uniref:Reverse transcriptase domain-containing protein n=1 Tax=Cyanistes caeruleus TaxID=156563 RepID=A0A8C0UC45_CYACU
MCLTVVYAKCKPVLRRPLWDNLRSRSLITSVPWCVIGDFNVIATIEEKIGGIPYQIKKSLEFLSMIEDCGLTDLGYYGSKYTWSNGRGPNSIVWKRLDRGLANDSWLAAHSATTITHLASAGSDHSPLLMELNDRRTNSIRYFKFLNCWTENETFMPLVQQTWNTPVFGNPMWIFHQKTKLLSHALSTWSRQEFGDIFQKVKDFEDKVREAEETWARTNKETDRLAANELTAQYIKHLKTEEAVLKQKTQLQWFKEGDANSKYFHSLIRGRRRKLYIHKIRTEDNEWIIGDEAIGQAACQYFQNLFTDPGGSIRDDLLSYIPSQVTEEDNDNLSKEPTMIELKQAVFSMSPTSAAGPDGLNGKFFQCCWDIIQVDLLNVVKAFFCGQSMPRYMTQACLVLIPKVEFPNTLSEFRPISLSNFINKIVSKILSLRLAPILPRIISPNQSGFIKGRSISENIMLAQEIVQGIKKPNRGANVVIKLDMAKAYDRVSWSFTCLMMRRMGFGETFIDMVWRTMSNNWYSVIVNGTRYGFFHSTRGLKQGDPLAPSLFILGAELLSQMLNNLTHDQFFNGFYMERRGPQITHLSFADDVIIFTSGCKTSLLKIMKVLQNYELASGQQINKNKSHFMTASSVFHYTNRRIHRLTGFTRKDSPITYLGCPLYTGRKRIRHFSCIITKVVSRIRGWHGRMLSYGGRLTLIKHVLQSLPIHLLSAVTPPKIPYQSSYVGTCGRIDAQLSMERKHPL